MLAGFRESRVGYAAAVVLVVGILSGCNNETSLTTGGGGGTGTTPVSTTITLQGIPGAAVAGDTVTLTATVSPSSSEGYVNFFDTFSSTPCSIAPCSFMSTEANNGVASATEVLSGIGTHSLTAEYAGNLSVSSPSPMSNPVLIPVSEPATATSCGLATATYILNNGSASFSGQTYASSTEDVGGVCAQGAGTSLTLIDPTITTSGDSTSVGFTRSPDPSGLNAGVLAYGASASSMSGATISVTGGSIATSGTNAAAVAASGLGASIVMNGTALSTTGSSSTDVSASNGGQITLTNVAETTAGQALAVNGDGSTLTVTGGSVIANGPLASLRPLASLQGGSLTLTNVAVSGQTSGIAFYTTDTGAEPSQPESLTITGGNYGASLFYTQNVFLVDNVPAVISLSNGSIASGNANLLAVESTAATLASSNCGTTLSATSESLAGAIGVSGPCIVQATLQEGTTFSGGVTNSSGGYVNVTLDGTSSWSVTENSNVGVFSDASGISGSTVTNVTGNGYNVYYTPSLNPSLGGKTYTLAGGQYGYLTPSS